MELTIEKITELVGSNESYTVSQDILKQLMNAKQREEMFNRFLSVQDDLTFDWFTEFFQEIYSDRKDKKQDFTPKELVNLASKIASSTTSNADIGGGTGGLTIRRWVDNPETTLYAEEFSDAVIPFLLFNLAIRNTNAIVRHGDALHQDFKTTYKLTKGEQFSTIETIINYHSSNVDTTVMNPPFSMKWERDKDYISDPRFKDYGLAPAGKSDYAFLLTGLSKLSDNGTLVAIMSPGILFRGGAEGDIRENLLKADLIDTIIQLPEKTFLKTPTGVIMVVLKKNRKNKNVLVIDASDEFEKVGKFNVVTPEHQDNIFNAYSDRKNVDRLANVVGLDEIEANDFNLNISLYVDRFVAEPEIDLYETYKELQEIEPKITEAESELQSMISQLVASTPETEKFLKEVANVS
ncbi:N-6 DNA methylase [Leuconostoc falkenbergense]|uniref:N-6 DNA methylase n=1 Tax=Leuconostoc falkenbergense TaxID=2766470 RepID=UPI001669773D|nr:N-6 DNA methylase [Leuconostoc falkenbergense]